jgi:sigma-B regulation protein RsbU (phosphoserine phosphatase)
MESETDKKISGLSFPEAELKQSIAGMPVRVLVAEDDSSIRLLIERSLRQENYEVVSAVDGEEAWQVLRDEDDPPRIAVIDWMMPKMDGLALCRKIKERETPFVFTIMLTAKTTNDDVIAGLRAGADEFLTKPFNLDVLRARVAAGARIVRLENLLTMKNSILEYYIEKVEKLAAERNGLTTDKDISP